MTVLIDGCPRNVRTVEFDPDANQVRLINQRLLPHRFEIFAAADYRQTAWAIREMVVRGAGAIGATAAFGLAQAALGFRSSRRTQFDALIRRARKTLAGARPTAVDPINAL